MANTQSRYAVRTKLQVVLNLPINQIRVKYYEGVELFGNSPACYDSSQAAAVLSQLAGAPVRLQFMRWDEHGWDNYGPAQMMDIQGGIDANGNLTAIQYTQFAIPGISQTLDDPTRQQVGVPLPAPGLGVADTSNWGRSTTSRTGGSSASRSRSSTTTSDVLGLRAPQAPQTVFGFEQMIDELAHAANMDPYQFRLQNITTTQQNQWRDDSLLRRSWRTGSRSGGVESLEGNVVTGRGIALGGFANSQAGVVVDITVNKKTGKITVDYAYTAPGRRAFGLPARNREPARGEPRDGHEPGAARGHRVQQGAGDEPRLGDLPDPALRREPEGQPPRRPADRPRLDGLREPPIVPIPAAIANALFDATGARLRSAPLTPPRVRAALAAAGVA